MNLRILGMVALSALALTGCGGGGSSPVAPARVPLASPQPGSVTVRFLWPPRTGTSSGRHASYISPSADHIRIIYSYNYYSNIAPSDQSVVVPYGTVSAQLPAAVGYNFYNFYEYDTSAATESSTHLLAYASQSLYLYDTATAATLDVVLKLNLSNMGAFVGASGSVVFTSATASERPGTNGVVKITNGAQGTTFTLFTAPTDFNGNIASGAGVPGMTLSTSDPRLTIQRVFNPNTTGPYVGLVAYTCTLNSTFSSPPPILINASAIDSNGNSNSVGQISLSLQLP